MLVNARHIKAVPGRKTDIKDSQWIAELLQHGLLRASFIPPVEQRDLRDLTRHRSNFIRERVNLVNRVEKVLEAANIKLASVASDVMGVSGRAMLAAIVEGSASPELMAELANVPCEKSMIYWFKHLRVEFVLINDLFSHNYCVKLIA